MKPTLSDEEFLAQGPATLAALEAASAKPPETPPVETPPVETPPVETPPVETPPSEPAKTPAEVTPPGEQTTENPGETAPPEPAKEPAKAGEETPPGEAAPKAGEETPPTEEPDYKAIYQALFGTPIRAGGQDITLQNVDEAKSLIQKGVGFHTKMNRLHGDLKYVEMLRTNNLLDESKLGLLIDAQAGKPGALKKLLDAAKVDPLTLDTNAEASTYAPSDYRVTDEQVRFQSVVSDLSDNASGQAVLQDARNWDKASKSGIYQNPELLSFLAQQKEMGRYDQIVAEVNRAKLLNQIPATESFIQSYTRVGNQMMQAGKFGPVTPTTTPTPTPVAQKTVTPPAPANAAKAKAAAPSKGSGPAAPAKVDISKLSDAEFEAHFKKVLNI